MATPSRTAFCKDYMGSFASTFAPFLGNTVVEIQVGMGPCGELRYPSYMLSQGWDYPGVGLIMAHDAGMQKMLKALLVVTSACVHP